MPIGSSRHGEEARTDPTQLNNAGQAMQRSDAWGLVRAARKDSGASASIPHRIYQCLSKEHSKLLLLTTRKSRSVERRMVPIGGYLLSPSWATRARQPGAARGRDPHIIKVTPRASGANTFKVRTGPTVTADHTKAIKIEGIKFPPHPFARKLFAFAFVCRGVAKDIVMSGHEVAAP